MSRYYTPPSRARIIETKVKEFHELASTGGIVLTSNIPFNITEKKSDYEAVALNYPKVQNIQNKPIDNSPLYSSSPMYHTVQNNNTFVLEEEGSPRDLAEDVLIDIEETEKFKKKLMDDSPISTHSNDGKNDNNDNKDNKDKQPKYIKEQKPAQISRFDRNTEQKQSNKTKAASTINNIRHCLREFEQKVLESPEEISPLHYPISSYSPIDNTQISGRVRISLWSIDLENEISKFAEICKEDAKIFKAMAGRNLFFGRGVQLMLISSGAITTYLSSANISSEKKEILQAISGTTTTILVAVYNLFAFTKKATEARQSALMLENLARGLRCELLKPEHLRKSPFDLIINAETQRDKLVAKLFSDE